MQTLLRYYSFSLAFSAACLALAVWYGWASTGNVTATLGILWIVLVLSILEVSLSFDNAVVNATVLRNMDPVWQRRFLTWGILIAVFGMRIIFPIAIVAVAAQVGPVEAINLSLNNPDEYQRIVSDAHVGIAGFGGAFLAMVGLTFFFEEDKEVHWIAMLERSINHFSSVPAIEIGLVLSVLYGVSTLLPPEDTITFLTAGILGLVTFIGVQAISSLLEEAEAKKRAEYHRNRSAKHTEASKAKMGYYEHQTHMVNYEKKGTFDDFNEMAIQYARLESFSISLLTSDYYLAAA